MVSARSFLIRGLLAGLIAGFFAFGVAYVVGEPSVNAAIAIEEAGSGSTGHTHADPAEPAHEHGSGEAADESGEAIETEVPRSLQATAGLLTATAVAGASLGGLLGILGALALGRFGSLGARGSTLLVTGVGFVSCSLLPFIVYPPNPPAVGQGDTISLRSGLYFALVAASVVLAVSAVVVGRMLARRWGAWYAGLAAAGGYLVAAAVVVALLPSYDEVPTDFPASVLYDFRLGSLAVQLTLWAVLGVLLAELVHRLTDRSPVQTPAPAAYADASR